MTILCVLFQANHLDDQWSGFQQPSSQVASWDTGVELDVLKFVGAKSVTVPEDLVSINC